MLSLANAVVYVVSISTHHSVHQYVVFVYCVETYCKLFAPSSRRNILVFP